MACGRNGKKTPPKTQTKRRGNRQRNKTNSSDSSPDSKKQKVISLKEKFTITPIVVSPVVNDKISQTSDFQLLEGATGMSDDSSKSSIPDPPPFKEIFLPSLILLLPPLLQKPIHIRLRISFKPFNLQLVHMHLLPLPL